jgi:hypothetical protein
MKTGFTMQCGSNKPGAVAFLKPFVVDLAGINHRLALIKRHQPLSCRTLMNVAVNPESIDCLFVSQ